MRIDYIPYVQPINKDKLVDIENILKTQAFAQLIEIFDSYHNSHNNIDDLLTHLYRTIRNDLDSNRSRSHRYLT